MNDQQLAEKANEVEKAGKAKFGEEAWSTMLGALSRMGVQPQQVADALRQPDAMDRFARAGREGLLNDLTNPDTAISRQAEKIHCELRERERDFYRRSRGR